MNSEKLIALLYVKINFARHQHDRKNQTQSGLVAVDSGFAIFVARQYGATNRESLR